VQAGQPPASSEGGVRLKNSLVDAPLIRFFIRSCISGSMVTLQGRWVGFPIGAAIGPMADDGGRLSIVVRSVQVV
jgi:hypothetical protein